MQKLVLLHEHLLMALSEFAYRNSVVLLMLMFRSGCGEISELLLGRADEAIEVLLQSHYAMPLQRVVGAPIGHQRRVGQGVALVDVDTGHQLKPTGPPTIDRLHGLVEHRVLEFDDGICGLSLAARQ